MAAIWRPQQPPHSVASPAAGQEHGHTPAFPPLPPLAVRPPPGAAFDPTAAPADSFGVSTPPLSAAPQTMTPALREWLAVRQPTIATLVLPLEPPPLQPQQAPAIPSNSPAMPLALPLPPAQQAAVLQLLQQLLLPALAVPPQTAGAAHPWQQAWQPAAAGSSNSEAPPEHHAGPEARAEAEAVAAAAAVLALAGEASSSGTATAEPAACPARSASPPPHLAPRDDAPLPFQPRSTQSVQAALTAPLPRGQAIRGARDQSGVWQGERSRFCASAGWALTRPSIGEEHPVWVCGPGGSVM